MSQSPCPLIFCPNIVCAATFPKKDLVCTSTFPKKDLHAPTRKLCVTCLHFPLCEADVGADHPRRLTWEPSDEQKRSIGVRMPEDRRAAPAEETPPPPTPVSPSPKAPKPRGSVKVELNA